MKFLLTRITFRLWQVLTFGIIVLGAWLMSLQPLIPSNGTQTLPGLVATTSYNTPKGDSYEKAPETIVSKIDMKRLTDSIRKSLGVSRVTHMNTIVQRIDTIYEGIPIYIDTNKDIYAVHQDRDIKVEFNGSYLTNKGSFLINLTPDTVSEINVLKKHLFKSNEHSILISHSNKLVKTTQASSISWKEPKTIFCAGPFFGAGYDGIKIRPVIGLGITFNLWSIKTR